MVRTDWVTGSETLEVLLGGKCSSSSPEYEVTSSPEEAMFLIFNFPGNAVFANAYKPTFRSLDAILDTFQECKGAAEREKAKKRKISCPIEQARPTVH